MNQAPPGSAWNFHFEDDPVCLEPPYFYFVGSFVCRILANDRFITEHRNRKYTYSCKYIFSHNIEMFCEKRQNISKIHLQIIIIRNYTRK